MLKLDKDWEAYNFLLISVLVTSLMSSRNLSKDSSLYKGLLWDLKTLSGQVCGLGMSLRKPIKNFGLEKDKEFSKNIVSTAVWLPERFLLMSKSLTCVDFVFIILTLVLLSTKDYTFNKTMLCL